MRTTPQSDGSGGGGGGELRLSQTEMGGGGTTPQSGGSWGGGGGGGTTPQSGVGVGGAVIGLEAIPQSDRRRELWKSWEPRLSQTEEGRCRKFGSYTSV